MKTAPSFPEPAVSSPKDQKAGETSFYFFIFTENATNTLSISWKYLTFEVLNHFFFQSSSQGLENPV